MPPPSNKKTFVLTSDVPNPTHDKRCKYGLRGVPVFKAGSKFTVTYWAEGEGFAKDYPQLVGTPNYVCLHDCRFGDYLTEKYLPNILLPAATEVTEAPKNLSEIDKLYPNIARGSSIVNQLLKTGVITVEQVVKASHDYFAEVDAAEAQKIAAKAENA